ncbi:fructosamine kinase family protein [Thalassospira mesophila]|uniref:fructosamine kinase family protein n=1 Tax=Thalassospira mesophila TaxID=1293891 RepID=UPI0013025EE4|nr:fructosamine kinase family protein [Thalassospira mesophila]
MLDRAITLPGPTAPRDMPHTRVIAKQTRNGQARTEGLMLTALGQSSPVPYPGVIFSDDNLLVMEYVTADGDAGRSGLRDLAPVLAAQHNVTRPDFGFDIDTLIGGLPQPNPATQNWIDFFRDHRLLFMANCAAQQGNLPAPLHRRLENLAPRLGEFIAPDITPSLLHGDLWGGNILYHQGKLAALIDPAVYYGDAEIELAFGTLFGDLTSEFFHCYQHHRPIDPVFFTHRRDLYNLYPLLVHARLFGGSYIGAIDRTLTRLGF